jgi:uncharacterized protein
VLILIAAVRLFGHDPTSAGALLTGMAQAAAGAVADFAIGVVAALMGVAGGQHPLVVSSVKVWRHR